MRIYEGAPRQDYEGVLRAVGTMLDQRGMREITLTETDDGFLLQGLALSPGEDKPWGDPAARLVKESIYLREDDFGRFMDEGTGRRGRPQAGDSGSPSGSSVGSAGSTGFYEQSLRVLGGYIDQQRPHDIHFFEQDRQFVLRLLMSTRAGLRHVIVEFTREEIESMLRSARHGRG